MNTRSKPWDFEITLLVTVIACSVFWTLHNIGMPNFPLIMLASAFVLYVDVKRNP